MGQGTGNGLDETDTRAVTKANFLFHFAASNEWTVSVKEGEFHLTVVGNERLHAELVDKYAMKLIGAQPLTIHGYSRTEDLPSEEFHHLVYCDVGGAELNRLALALADTPTVLVPILQMAWSRERSSILCPLATAFGTRSMRPMPRRRGC